MPVKMTAPANLIVMVPAEVTVLPSSGPVQPTAIPATRLYPVVVVHTTGHTPVLFPLVVMQHAKKHVPIVVAISYTELIFKLS